jgi:anti-sigma B factor antagonist
MRLADLQVESRDDVVLARVEGEVDLSNAGGLRTSLLEEMTNEALGLVIDLTAVRYLDSAGIHMLFELRERLHHRGQRLRLVVPPNSLIAKTLEIVGASSAIGLFATSDAALAAARGAPPT